MPCCAALGSKAHQGEKKERGWDEGQEAIVLQWRERETPAGRLFFYLNPSLSAQARSGSGKPHNPAMSIPVFPPLLWDVFCRVIDNHGDLGVCWRLARQLAACGQHVRLWVDDASALGWMAPEGLHGGVPGLQLRPWAEAENPAVLAGLPRADVWVEAFGCELPSAFVAAGAQATAAPPVWVNLEYLSAEDWVERMHGLPSPVLHGPAAGWVKHFFYPGFRPGTGGLLREPGLMARRQAFERIGWLAGQGVDWQGETLVSLFCYEPVALADWLAQLAEAPRPVRLLVTAGRAREAVAQALGQALVEGHSLQRGRLCLHALRHLSQHDYDHLLWACDLNAVRGEDSLVRALWAGQPLLWHIYPQPEDNAHHAKLDAWLDWLDAPAELRRWHRAWNGIDARPLSAPLPDLDGWRGCVQAARQRLLGQGDLLSQLMRHMQEQRAAAQRGPA